MKKYEELQKFSFVQFRRLTGVKKETFDLMLKILKHTRISKDDWAKK